MQQYFKISKHRWLLPVIVMLFTVTATAQLPADVSNTTNYGAASWGVGIGPNAFTVSGPYDATSNTATDHFYDANSPTGTPIEISGNTAPAFYNLVFDNGATAAAAISNTAGIDVYGNLQLLNGITTTNNNIAGAIRLTADATISGTFGAARYIDGYVGKPGANSFTFPVGNAGIYSPVTFSNPAGTTLRYTAGDPGATVTKDNTQGALNLITVSTLEYYTASSSAPAGSTVTIPYGNFGGGYVTDPASLTIAGWDGSKWVNLGTASNAINTGDQTVTVTLSQPLSGFTQFTLGSTSALNTLPVTLTSFTGTVTTHCTALLTWKTATEAGSGHYEVEVSTDGAQFSKAGTVVSQNLPSGASYSYGFNSLTAGTYYFRLKMVDIDRRYTYSKIITVASHCSNTITIAPNPVNEVVNIYGLSGKNSIMIVDATGRQVIRLQSSGVTQSIPVGNLLRGTYIVRIIDESGKVTTSKITKL